MIGLKMNLPSGATRRYKMEKVVLKLKETINKINDLDCDTTNEIYNTYHVDLNNLNETLTKIYEVLADETDWSKIKEDTPVFIKNEIDDDWRPAHFHSVIEEKGKRLFRIFPNGKTSFTFEPAFHSLHIIKYCKLAKPKEE